MLRKASLTKVPRLVKLLPLLLLLGACATGAIREKVLSLPMIEGATPVGKDACLECHEEMGPEFAKSIHGRLAGFEYMGGTESCESCHGNGSLHIDSGDTDKILTFSDLRPEETAAICAKCHTNGKLMDWTHSEHALSDVSCDDCHSMHAGGKMALKQQDPDLCFGCHQEQMAQTGFPSHHPIKEGKMTCSDCHNPHGELETQELARDLCLECHSRHQGPFVFEHAPVEEDCSICHDPHGSVANNLLLQNEPFLCLQCHESHFHTMRIGADPGPLNTLAFDSNALDGSAPVGSPTAANSVPFTNSHGEDGWRKAFGTKCTVCHSVVHGSDLPSQSSPTTGNNGEGWPDGGKGLTR